MPITRRVWLSHWNFDAQAHAVFPLETSGYASVSSPFSRPVLIARDGTLSGADQPEVKPAAACARTVVDAGMTVTVTVSHTEPPGPEHSRVKVEVPLRAPVDCDPLVSLMPLQPSRAMQLVALVDDQVSVELSP